MNRLTASIAQLPPLDEREGITQTGTCKICEDPAVFFDRVDFNKFCNVDDYTVFGASGIAVTYQRCLSCGFVFTTDFDDWTTAEFAAFIYNADYIKVDGDYAEARPRRLAADFAERFAGCEHARILDYGSGTGIFAGGMRQRGFRHVENYDPFSDPSRPAGSFDIVTCFEVMEHSPDPAATLADMKRLLRPDGCIIFSQTLQPPDILSVRGSWWYLAPRNGHVSTFTAEALAELGRRQALAFHTGDTVFGFAGPQPSSYARVALQSAGPSLAVLRVQAPVEAASAPIAFPTQDDILWHAAGYEHGRLCRWTAAAAMGWEARWGAVARLQVRVPFCGEAERGLAARCALELDGHRRPVRLDRRELVAEFEVAGRSSGLLTLHVPQAEIQSGPQTAGRRGLAIPTSGAPRRHAARPPHAEAAA